MAHLENHAVGNARESVSDVPRRWRLFLGFAFALAVEAVTLGSGFEAGNEDEIWLHHGPFWIRTRDLSLIRTAL